MPELPEVQTIVSELDEKIKHKTIKSVQVFKYKSVRPMNKKFVQAVKGKKILGVARRAKMIIINLSGDKHLLIHLKMTGQLVYFSPPARGVVKQRPGASGARVDEYDHWEYSALAQDGRGGGSRDLKAVSGGHAIPRQTPPNLPLKRGGNITPTKFTRVMFEFTDKSHLFFNDIRRFGWIKFADKKLYESETGKYGLEPLSKDFTFSAFKEKLKRYPNRKIKQVLMDQSLIAGVGNIYADEVCFAAKVLPTRPANKLTEKESKEIFRAIPRILKLSISKKGTSADTYVTTSGAEGGMMKYLKVYGRAGERCKRCGGTIHKIKLGGRGTHFCPSCQK